MKWTLQGEQHVALGTLGEYRIDRPFRAGWHVLLGKPGRKRTKTVGCYTSLENAKRMAEVYDGYRASPPSPAKQRALRALNGAS